MSRFTQGLAVSIGLAVVWTIHNSRYIDERDLENVPPPGRLAIFRSEDQAISAVADWLLSRHRGRLYVNRSPSINLNRCRAQVRDLQGSATAQRIVPNRIDDYGLIVPLNQPDNGRLMVLQSGFASFQQRGAGQARMHPDDAFVEMCLPHLDEVAQVVRIHAEELTSIGLRYWQLEYGTELANTGLRTQQIHFEGPACPRKWHPWSQRCASPVK